MLLLTFVVGFSINISFHFSRINIQNKYLEKYHFSRIKIAGSYIRCIFNFIGTHQVVFHCYIILYFHQQYMVILVVLHPGQRLLLVRSFLSGLSFSIPIGILWYFTVLFICISLITNNVQHIFRCLFVTCISFFVCSEFCPS